MSLKSVLGAFSQVFFMISKTYWKVLDHANHELALRFEKLKKARASGDNHAIQQAEMGYFHALQRLYDGVQNAVSERGNIVI